MSMFACAHTPQPNHALDDASQAFISRALLRPPQCRRRGAKPLYSRASTSRSLLKSQRSMTECGEPMVDSHTCSKGLSSRRGAHCLQFRLDSRLQILRRADRTTAADAEQALMARRLRRCRAASSLRRGAGAAHAGRFGTGLCSQRGLARPAAGASRAASTSLRAFTPCSQADVAHKTDAHRKPDRAHLHLLHCLFLPLNLPLDGALHARGRRRRAPEAFQLPAGPAAPPCRCASRGCPRQAVCDTEGALPAVPSAAAWPLACDMFWQYPTSPSCFALSVVQARKKTPWTGGRAGQGRGTGSGVLCAKCAARRLRSMRQPEWVHHSWDGDGGCRATGAPATHPPLNSSLTYPKHLELHRRVH